jgi:hypothetical protein
MEEYAVPRVVEYLHVADSLVVRDIVVLVVPAGRVPDGLPPERPGGVVSGTDGAEYEMPFCLVPETFRLPDWSVA